jgi:hypothetical protein
MARLCRAAIEPQTTERNEHEPAMTNTNGTEEGADAD